MRILIVEDNEDNRRLAGKRLRASGHTLLEVTRGAEAMDRIRADRPDVVLLDLQLPDIDGLELVRQVRAEPDIADTVIVACTAFAMMSDRKKALDAGCNGYIPKPVDIRALSDQIQEIWHAAQN